MNPILKIDPEFQTKIPPLTEEEYQQLEDNILSEGMILMPIIVWHEIIVDGHNRYKITQEHPEIPFSVYNKTFTNRYDAIAWICRNQLGRRNLTPQQRKYLIGQQYEAEKMSHDGDRKSGMAESTVQNEPLIGPESLISSHATRQKVASENGTTESYVMRAGWYANGIDAAEEMDPGIKEDLLTGKVKAADQTVAEIAKAPVSERKQLVEDLRSPKTKPGLPADTYAPPKKRSISELNEIERISEELARPKPPA